MARYRLSNVTVEFDLAAAGATPVPVPTPTPTPTPTPDPLPDPVPDPEPGPAPTPAPNPVPVPVGEVPILTPRATPPRVPSSMWGYAEPIPVQSLLDTPAGAADILVAHGLDGDDADTDPDPIYISNQANFPTPFIAGTRSYKKGTLSNMPNALETSGIVYEVTDDGPWPKKPDWRILRSCTVILKEGGEYWSTGESLPNSKALFPLGIPDPSSYFTLKLNGATLRDAALPKQDGNGAVIRVTRCALVYVEGPGKIINCQMPILHDGTYNGVRGLRLEVRNGIEFIDSGAVGTPNPGRSHPIYTQLELELVVVAGCSFLRVKNEGNFIQIRGRQSLIEDNVFDWDTSNASRAINLPHAGLHTIRRNRFIFGASRPDVKPIGLGVSSGKEDQNHKGPNGFHIHDNVFDFRDAAGNVPRKGIVQMGAMSPDEWLNWHDNQIVTA